MGRSLRYVALAVAALAGCVHVPVAAKPDIAVRTSTSSAPSTGDPAEAAPSPNAPPSPDEADKLVEEARARRVAADQQQALTLAEAIKADRAATDEKAAADKAAESKAAAAEKAASKAAARRVDEAIAADEARDRAAAERAARAGKKKPDPTRPSGVDPWVVKQSDSADFTNPTEKLAPPVHLDNSPTPSPGSEPSAPAGAPDGQATEPAAEAPAPSEKPAAEPDDGEHDLRRVTLPKWTPIRGPRDAKVTIVVWSDFQCPFCKRILPALAQIERQYAGDVRIAFRNDPLPFHAHASDAAEAALAAGAQGKFWQMHDLLFDNQADLEPGDLDQYARQAGLDMKRYRADLAAHRYRGFVAADAAEAESLAVHGTPTLFVNGRRLVGAQPIEAIRPLIVSARAQADQLLAAGTPRDRIYDRVLESIHEAHSDEEQPERVEVHPTANAPSRGPSDAKVTIVEFMDFQCPFCSRAQATMDELLAKYKGKLRIVFLNNPLSFHPNAQLAAEAAVAADAQGKFWPMHDRLFRDQEALGREDIERYAGEIGLDVKRFWQALDDGHFGGRVAQDVAEAERLGVNGTPVFFINGIQIVGAQPITRFERLIDSELGHSGGRNTGNEKPAHKARKHR